MRIVDVCAFYSPQGGGVRTYVERKLATLPALGHEIIVLAPGRANSIVRKGPGAMLMTVASPTLPVDKRYCYFADREAIHDALDSLQPDFVEASSPWSSATKVAEWQGAAPRALVMHADPLAAYAYRWLGRLASRRRIDRLCSPFWQHLREMDRKFDLVISPGASLAKRLTDGGLEKVRSVPLGVEPGIFSPRRRHAEVRAELLERLGLPSNGMILIGLGRFAGEKRWPMVIEAVANAGEQRPVGLLLIGSGKQAEKIRKVATAASRVAMMPPVGNRAELAGLVASCDAFVHGCESETFCLVASEARASGLPIIVPDRGGAFDQLSTGGGLAYRAGDGEALRAAIVRLYDSHDKAAEASRVASRVRTLDEHFVELARAYEQTVAGQGEFVLPSLSPDFAFLAALRGDATGVIRL